MSRRLFWGGLCWDSVLLGETECFESDERLNLYEKGQIIDKKHNVAYWDACLNGSTLREYYCGLNNYFYYSFNCPNGCKDGACLELTTKQKSKSCEDSDALYPIWVNFNEKGSVTAEGGLNKEFMKKAVMVIRLKNIFVTQEWPWK